MENKSEIRLRGMLGFAMRAGKITVGTELVCSSMARDGKDRPRIVLVSHSASDGTKKKIFTKCEFYGIDCFEIKLDSDELGRLLGKLYAPATVAITDDGFAKEIRLALIDIGKGDTDN